jgi:hypothetical protein
MPLPTPEQLQDLSRDELIAMILVSFSYTEGCRLLMCYSESEK